MALTRDQILAMVDIDIKKLVLPDHLAKWAGQELYIRQLSRGDQDMYLKRMNGENEIVNGIRKIKPVNYYGHDAWLCSRGVCDEHGQRIFGEEDVAALNEKSGEFVGWLANEILKYSGMVEDVALAKKSSKEKLKDEIKN